MCKNNCKTCAGYNDKRCLKGIDFNTVEDECNEWFPKECPITGLEFNSLMYGESGELIPGYSCYPHYSSYTLPEYDSQSQEFTRVKFDEDEGCWDDGCESLGTLEELEEEVSKERLKEIKTFYKIA